MCNTFFGAHIWASEIASYVYIQYRPPKNDNSQLNNYDYSILEVIRRSCISWNVHLWNVPAVDFAIMPAHDFQFLMHETYGYLRRMRHLIGKKSHVVVFDEV